MFYQVDSTEFKKLAEGVEMKVLVHGENTLMGLFKLAAGSQLPNHDHPHEQTGYVISGRTILKVDGREPFESGPGGAWNIPGGVAHSAEALEDSLIVEVFHPVREDYLAK